MTDDLVVCPRCQKKYDPYGPIHHFCKAPSSFFQDAKPVDAASYANRPSTDVDLSVAIAEAMRKNLEAETPANRPPRLIRCDSPEAAVMLVKHGFTPLVHPDNWDETVALLKAEGMWEE